LLVGAHDVEAAKTYLPPPSVWSFRHTIATQPPAEICQKPKLSTGKTTIDHRMSRAEGLSTTSVFYRKNFGDLVKRSETVTR
jgi:hypothetical protein